MTKKTYFFHNWSYFDFSPIFSTKRFYSVLPDPGYQLTKIVCNVVHMDKLKEISTVDTKHRIFMSSQKENPFFLSFYNFGTNFSTKRYFCGHCVPSEQLVTYKIPKISIFLLFIICEYFFHFPAYIPSHLTITFLE